MSTTPALTPAAISALFQSASSAIQEGRLDMAQMQLQQILNQDNRHADALQMLGVVSFQKNDLAQAESWIKQALVVREDASFLYNLGNVLEVGQQPAKAEEAYRRALAIKPDFVQALYNLAGLLQNNRQLAESEGLYRQAIAIAPRFVQAWFNLGNLLQAMARFNEAEAAYRQVLVLNPNFVDAHNNLGNLLLTMERLEEAENSFRRAIALAPEFAGAHNNLGNLLQTRERLTEAENAYRQALHLKPHFVEALNNLGNVLLETGRIDDAEATYRHAIAMKPDYANAYSNLGNVLQKIDRMPEAEAALHDSLALQQDYPDAHYNLGNLYKHTRRFAEAEAAYRRAIALKPTFTDANYGLGLLLLAQGRYDEAWPYYEHRYNNRQVRPDSPIPDFPFPQWRSEPLNGKTILIWPEQGYGDYIQFVRYARLLKEHGAAQVDLFCSSALKPLLETAAGVDRTITDFTTIGTYDYWTFPMSLPLRFHTGENTLPAELPYLRALPWRVEQWRSRLPADGLKIGLSWKGNIVHDNDADRSLPGIATLAPLWENVDNNNPRLHFISLQKGQAEDEALRPPANQPLISLGTDILDFADTAAIIAQLDLVICVDTSVAHVAGALGKPCWVMLPAYRTDWRWQFDRADSPWYPEVMRLFRQTTRNDWSDVVRDINLALVDWRKSNAGS